MIYFFKLFQVLNNYQGERFGGKALGSCSGGHLEKVFCCIDVFKRVLYKFQL